MNFHYTAYGRHRCLFCGTQADLAVFAIDFEEGGKVPSFEELVAMFGPYVMMSEEYVGTKVIICSCREHIRHIGSLRDLSKQELTKELFRIRGEVELQEKQKREEQFSLPPLDKEGYWW